MTTTDTMDTKATVAQSIRMIEAGCEYVRITAPSMNEARNLEEIKQQIRQAGFETPLIADIHFTPNAAELAARIVEKVRINPGNYADKKRFDLIEYTDEQYQAELERIRNRFVPLIKICKAYGTAMRIGTNHGSLSDRIMSRYGDTPLGMVESAMEFVRICEEEGYHEIVLSMKSSNPIVMVQANRLLLAEMIKTGRNYPIHLGVTEAGDGEDGRIKSAIGIGTLLEDGIGDTIRVSLTEEPEAEIPVAQAIVNRYYRREGSVGSRVVKYYINPFQYQKRKSKAVYNIGAEQAPVVIADFSTMQKIEKSELLKVGYRYSESLDKWIISEQAADYIFCGDQVVDYEIPGTLGLIYNYNTWLVEKGRADAYPFLQAKQYLQQKPGTLHKGMNFIYALLSDLSEEFLFRLHQDPTAVLLIDTYHPHGMAEQRAMINTLLHHHCKVPVILGRAYGSENEQQFVIDAAVDTGALLVDGLGDGLFICPEECASAQTANRTAFGILQATRTRISKTEFISCPSCGRTLFDLQVTTAKIRDATSHLKGLKIGIMGCIVNGPGEMADADYGYVGSGPGKITLYKGKEVTKRNIHTKDALDELIRLIKANGDWVDQ